MSFRKKQIQLKPRIKLNHNIIQPFLSFSDSNSLVGYGENGFERSQGWCGYFLSRPLRTFSWLYQFFLRQLQIASVIYLLSSNYGPYEDVIVTYFSNC